MTNEGPVLLSFDLGDIGEDTPYSETILPMSAPPKSGPNELEEWAEAQVSGAAPSAVHFDIETGPRPENELRALYHEKTLEEFAETCDKRWKPETVAVKYEEYKVKAWDEFVSRAALSPVTGRVLLISVLGDKDKAPAIIANDENEPAMLYSFWILVEDWLANKTRIIGHNSNSFDLPFLVRRSWLLGVYVPREIRQGRYWHPLFRDTMEWWACGARGEMTSLNTLGAFFGVGQKTKGVSGGDFAKLWFGTPEDRAKALEYAEQDVRLTAAIAAKMGMVP